MTFSIIRCQMIEHSNKKQHWDFIVLVERKIYKKEHKVYLSTWKEQMIPEPVLLDDKYENVLFICCYIRMLLLAKDENFKAEGI